VFSLEILWGVFGKTVSGKTEMGVWNYGFVCAVSEWKKTPFAHRLWGISGVGKSVSQFFVFVFFGKMFL
jgi:hypothetical protein